MKVSIRLEPDERTPDVKPTLVEFFCDETDTEFLSDQTLREGRVGGFLGDPFLIMERLEHVRILYKWARDIVIYREPHPKVVTGS